MWLITHHGGIPGHEERLHLSVIRRALYWDLSVPWACNSAAVTIWSWMYVMGSWESSDMDFLIWQVVCRFVSRTSGLSLMCLKSICWVPCVNLSHIWLADLRDGLNQICEKDSLQTVIPVQVIMIQTLSVLFFHYGLMSAVAIVVKIWLVAFFKVSFLFRTKKQIDGLRGSFSLTVRI